jgi:hypothetical protein
MTTPAVTYFRHHGANTPSAGLTSDQPDDNNPLDRFEIEDGAWRMMRKKLWYVIVDGKDPSRRRSRHSTLAFAERALAVLQKHDADPSALRIEERWEKRNGDPCPPPPDAHP